MGLYRFRSWNETHAELCLLAYLGLLLYYAWQLESAFTAFVVVAPLGLRAWWFIAIESDAPAHPWRSGTWTGVWLSVALIPALF